MTSGKFIAFEGGEGCGKSTQARLLADTLEKRGIIPVLTREPGGTAQAEAIRTLLLYPPGGGWNPRAEALLFAAARSDHVEKLIRPTMADGKWVICDRFVDSSRAYQGGAGGMGDGFIQQLHDAGSEGLRPHMTLLFEVDEAAIAQRLAARDGADSDAIGGRGAAYHKAVGSAFRGLAAADPDGFRIIDGNGSIEEVRGRVLSAISPLLDLAA